MRGEVDAELRAALAAEEPLGPPPTRSIIEQVLAQPTRALEDQLDELDRVRDKTVRP
jgi:hypothetical protein